MTSFDVAKSIYAELSDVCLALDDPINALDIIDRGIKQLPNEFELYRKKALIFTSKGKKEEAIQAYKEYFKVLPINKDPWRILDLTYVADSIISTSSLMIESRSINEAEDFLVHEIEIKRENFQPISLRTAPCYNTSLLLAQAKVSLATDTLEKAP